MHPQYTSDAPLKQCSKCNKWLPDTKEFFYAANGKLRNECKTCQKARIKAWKEANPEKAKAYKDAYHDENRDKINKGHRERRAANPEKAKAYRKANAEKLSAYGKARYRKNVAKRKIERREWYKANAEKIKEQSREYSKKYIRENGDKLKAKTQRRRARKASLPATFTHDQWKRCLGYFSGCCAVCGKPAGLFHTLAMDHWIPISSPNCPGTVATNIVPLCHGKDGCNQSKNKRDALEWLTERFGKRKATSIAKKIQKYFDSLSD